MGRLAILADDLTGALDTAAPFAAKDDAVTVAWRKAALAGRGAYAFDTETRQATAEDAMAAVLSCLPRLRDAGIAFKKLDSLMRGNSIEELAACAGSRDFASVVIAPAFPEQGRITRGGRQIAPARGEAGPVDVDLAGALARRHIPVRVFGRGEAPPESGVAVCDAETAEDLAHLADAAPGLKPPVLWCGTAGLARALGSPVTVPARDLEGRRLIVVGTRHPVSVAQAARLREHMGRDAVVIGRATEVAAKVRDADAILAAGRSVALIFALPPLDPPAAEAAIAAALTDLAKIDPPEVLVVTGGDTLYRLCQAIGRREPCGNRRMEPWRSGLANRRRGVARRHADLEVRRLWRSRPSDPYPQQCDGDCTRMNARRIGITMGDPAGIGPEIILKALAELAVRDGAHAVSPIIYGTRAAMGEGARVARPRGRRSSSPPRARNGQASRLLECGEARHPIRLATIDAEAGRLAFAAIDHAVKDAMAGRIAAIVTAPISKEAVNLAGYAYAGHTDMLADLTGSRDTCMLLAHENLRVAHVSTHVALARVPSLVTPERLTRVLELTLDALHRFGIDKPRIAVAALNPHAGEGGLFGTEDATVIAPTVEAFRQRGVDVSGPIPGDTVFVRALGNEFDAVIAMYHDQGHIPLKLLGFRIDPVARKWTALSGVNITLGLPFVRTSVDHGTAFDIAGKGIASAQSMVEAIDLAIAMISDTAGDAPAIEKTGSPLGTH